MAKHRTPRCQMTLVIWPDKHNSWYGGAFFPSAQQIAFGKSVWAPPRESASRAAQCSYSRERKLWAPERRKLLFRSHAADKQPPCSAGYCIEKKVKSLYWNASRISMQSLSLPLPWGARFMQQGNAMHLSCALAHWIIADSMPKWNFEMHIETRQRDFKCRRDGSKGENCLFSFFHAPNIIFQWLRAGNIFNLCKTVVNKVASVHIRWSAPQLSADIVFEFQQNAAINLFLILKRISFVQDKITLLNNLTVAWEFCIIQHNYLAFYVTFHISATFNFGLKDFNVIVGAFCKL